MDINPEDIAKKKKQLKGLFKKLTDEELEAKAIESLSKKIKTEEVDLDDIFVNPSEKKYANELLAKYLHDYTIETVSDKNTLKQLIFLEIINYRLQDSLNTLYNASNTLDKDVLELTHKNQTQILQLKEKLGINRDKKSDSVKDGYGYLQLVKRKYKIWLEENQASRTLTCPECSKLIFLKIKTDVWEAQRHKFFKDRILGNPHLIKLYSEGKLTKKDLSLVFGTSEDYVEWLCQKWAVKDNEFVSHSEITEDKNEKVNE